MAFILILIVGWIHAKSVSEQQLREYAASMIHVAAGQATLAFHAARKNMRDLTEVIQFGSTEGSLGLQARANLERVVERTVKYSQSMVSLAVFDTDGRLLAGESRNALELSRQVSSQAEPSFPTAPHESIAMSAPFRSADGGKWLLQLRGRLTDTNGLTTATVVATHELERFFAEFAQDIPLGADESIALFDLNDRQVAFLSKSGVKANLTDSAGNASQEGSIRYVAEGDQVQLGATRQVQGYPYYVLYRKNMDAWFLKWRQEQFVLALAVLGALVVTAAVTTGIQRRLALTEQLQRTRSELEESNTALRATLAAAELLAARDQLTGLCNRRNFDQRLESAIARCARHGDDFSLLMIDLDHFKNINDYYGHATGDDVLRRFGEVLRERLRQNDVAARWGGEEFVVLADGASMENARLLAEQIREWVAVTTFPPVPRVTVSIGVADYQPGESGDDLLKRADRALYNAKRNGRNRVMASESSHAAVNVVKMQSA